MGTREIIFLLYTFVLPLLAIILDDAKWDRKEKERPAKKVATSTPSGTSGINLGGTPHPQV